jgi:hypothetical protein
MRSRGLERTPREQRQEEWFVRFGVAIALVAFAWAGIVENKSSSNPVIHYPWTLFLFFSFVLIALEGSILTDPKLPRAWAPSSGKIKRVFAVTVASVLIVGIARLWGTNILDWLKHHIPNFSLLITTIAEHRAATFFVLNAALIILSWIGIIFFTSPTSNGEGSKAPLPGEQTAGNFVAAIAFSLFLALVFNTVTMNLLGSLLTNNTAFATSGPNFHSSAPLPAPVTACDLNYWSMPTTAAAAHCSLSALDPQTLLFLDLILLPLIYFICAYGILSGPATMRAVREGKAEEVPYTLRETWVELWRRKVQLPTLVVPLQLIWPALIFAAVFIAAVAADNSANAIQYVSTQAIRHDPKGHIYWQSIWFWFSQYGKDLLLNLGYRFGAVLAVGVSALLTVVAVTVLLIPNRRSSGEALALRRHFIFSWHHSRLIVGLLVFLYGVSSLVFSAINAIILAGVNIYETRTGHLALGWHWVPFVQPDPVAIPSLLLLLYYVFRGRGSRPHLASPPATE